MIRGDKYGYRARIGYTSPPLTSEVFPYEFYKLAPDGVTLVITTLAITVRSAAEVDQSYDISMKAAEQMAEAGCNAIVLGGVPINLAKGAENAAQIIKDLEQKLGIPVATSASAQKEAFARLGCRKLVVAHPYKDDDNHRFDDYAQKFGASVLGTRAWGSAFNRIGAIPDDAALKMARELMKAHPEADTIMFPSPHWPVINAIEPLEKEFGVTVMSSIQAILWQAFRLAGIKDSLSGYGRLFKDF
jgi:maleate cis-trans isomerase